MYKKLSILFFCALLMSASASAKTTYPTEHTTGWFGYHFVVDTCVLLGGVTFKQKSRFEFVPSWSCSDFDDPHGVLYQWTGEAYSPEDAEYMKELPENQAGAVLTITFNVDATYVYPRTGPTLHYIDFLTLKFVSSTYRMTLKALEKAEGKGMATNKVHPAILIRNGRLGIMSADMRRKTGTPAFWYEGGAPSDKRTGEISPTRTPSPSRTTSTPTSTTRTKIMADMLQEMVGKSMESVKKDWSKPVSENKTGNTTEIAWASKHGFMNKKSCLQKLYFDNSTSKVIGWAHDCPDGNYGKLPASAPVPTPYK